jgi:sulfopyruvate decarboxylase TPP-binding subunit
LDCKIIDIGFNSIDKILHVADIHIRNYTRHKEYRKVFKELYVEVDKLSENSIVYVG